MTWSINWDGSKGWTFGDNVKSLIGGTASRRTTPTPTPTPTSTHPDADPDEHADADPHAHGHADDAERHLGGVQGLRGRRRRHLRRQAVPCRQAHTSLPGWEPPNVLALWLPL